MPPIGALDPTLPLPQGDPSPRFAGDANLPLAAGGDGNPDGRGAGFGPGDGNGAGSGGMGREWGVLRKVIAVYPPKALKQGIQGYVVVQVTVNGYGVPIQVKPVRGNDLLMAECLRVLPLWQFESPGKYGLRAPVSFPVVYKFEID